MKTLRGTGPGGLVMFDDRKLFPLGRLLRARMGVLIDGYRPDPPALRALEAVVIEPCFEVLHREAPILAVLDVVLAVRDELHQLDPVLGEPDGFDLEVVLGVPAEVAPAPRRLHLPGWDLQRARAAALLDAARVRRSV